MGPLIIYPLTLKIRALSKRSSPLIKATHPSQLQRGSFISALDRNLHQDPSPGDTRQFASLLDGITGQLLTCCEHGVRA